MHPVAADGSQLSARTAFVGANVGDAVGATVGAVVGTKEGEPVGDAVGVTVGNAVVGALVGAGEGEIVGDDGALVGAGEGETVGEAVGVGVKPNTGQLCERTQAAHLAAFEAMKVLQQAPWASGQVLQTPGLQ